MKKLFVLTVFLLAAGLHAGHTQVKTVVAKYAPTDVSSDMAYMYKTLQASAYNLFVSTPKSEFDKAFDRIMRSLKNRKDSLTKLATFMIFQRFAAMAQLAHLTLEFPYYDVYENYKANGGTLFPFGIRIEGKRVYIQQNYSSDSSFARGDEILFINGKPPAYYLDGIYAVLSGENEYFKSTLVDIYGFPKMYWQVYGRSDIFNMDIKKAGMDVKTQIKVKAITATEFDKVNKGITEILHFDRRFRLIDDQTAYYHPGIFLNMGAESTSSHESFEKGEFIRFLDSSFLQIHLHKIKNLIIDLRGNPGGDDSFSNPMIAYFANKPFWGSSRFSVKTSELTKKFWKDVKDSTLADIREAILSHKDGEIFDVPLPTYPPREDSLKFTGRVYVLINRHSYSNAATTPALIQDYGFGKIVGETTADCPTLYAAIHDFKLPHTQFAVSYPKAFMVRPNGNAEFKGVVPDYPVAGDDTKENEDFVLSYTLQLIQKNKY